MKRYNMAEARKNLSEAVSRAAFSGERIVIGRRDRDLAALVPMEDLELLEWIEDQEDIKEITRRLKQGKKGIPWEKAKKTLGLK